jgi:Glycosyltransferase family 87
LPINKTSSLKPAKPKVKCAILVGARMQSLIDRLNKIPWWVVPIMVWGIMVASVLIRVAVSPVTKSSVYPVFATAGKAFSEGKPLYASREGAYRYAPAWAAFFALGNDQPQQVTSSIWRLLNLAVLIWAAYRFQKWFFPLWNNVQISTWWFMMFPICLGSFNNAQANLLLLGLLLGAIVTFGEKRYTLCGILLAIAISLKIYPIALALLLLLVQPKKLLIPLIIGLLLIAGLPFLFQDAGYVLDQYRCWFNSTTGDLRIDRDISDTNRDVWLLIRITHLPLEYTGYQILQLLSALALAAWTWFNRHAIMNATTANNKLIQLFSLAITWMLVFGPASESSTYALVAPTLAMAVVLICTTRQSLFLRLGVALSYLLMLVAHLGSAFPNGTVPHEYGIHPIASLLLAACVPLLHYPPRQLDCTPTRKLSPT